MQRLRIDLETYSPVDLKVFGVYAYTEHPDFRILMAAYSMDGEPVQVAVGHDDILAAVGRYLNDPSVLKVAHNAQFERVCLSRAARLPRHTFFPPDQYHDTMAVAAEKGYPQALGQLAQWLGGEQKDEAGTLLINLFCKPRLIKGVRRAYLPHEKPGEWMEFMLYCAQDVETLASVDDKLGDWPNEAERQAYIADQIINDTGVKTDLELAAAAVSAAELNKVEQEARIRQLTGIDNPGSLPQMLGWLRSAGVAISNLQKETVSDLLSGDLPASVREVLELRQELALVASKKYTTLIGSTNTDGRARGQFKFFGAHTGRWTGRGIQLHNLPRAGFKTEDEINQAILDLMLTGRAAALNLKKLVRPTLVGPFGVVDYASIEARVIAWLAGEEWALAAFKLGRDIYVETAGRMSDALGLTGDHRFDRPQGKVAVLALGYQGGPNSLRHMGAEGNDAQLKKLVTAWRTANPNIVGLWGELDQVFRTGGTAGRLTVEVDGDTRRILLPSGRAIWYHGYKSTVAPDGYGNLRRRQSFRSPSRGWREDTYGGKLAENATQAVARDILAEALVRLVQRGHKVVGHVHDEILVEGSSAEEARAVMVELPQWAEGLPIDGAGFNCTRYRKE